MVKNPIRQSYSEPFWLQRAEDRPILSRAVSAGKPKNPHCELTLFSLLCFELFHA